MCLLFLIIKKGKELIFSTPSLLILIKFVIKTLVVCLFSILHQINYSSVFLRKFSLSFLHTSHLRFHLQQPSNQGSLLLQVFFNTPLIGPESFSVFPSVASAICCFTFLLICKYEVQISLQDFAKVLLRGSLNLNSKILLLPMAFLNFTKKPSFLSNLFA